MPDFIFCNQKLQSTKDSFLSAISSAALYGRGIFTTIAVHDSIPFLWEKHWRRLRANARKINLDFSEFSENSVYQSLRSLIEKNDLTRGRARLTFYDETPSSVWQNNVERKTGFLIQTADFRRLPETFRLTVSPYLVNSASPLAGVKSCNYLENILSLENAKAGNFDEAIRLNERGEIVSACTANVFWTRAGKIYTPSLETGCLNGTTREFISEIFNVTETKADLKWLEKADEIFLTSAGIGVVKATFDKR